MLFFNSIRHSICNTCQIYFKDFFERNSNNLARNAERDYKTLFTNTGMAREYNYFKKAKEVVTREDDLNFEELRNKLIS